MELAGVVRRPAGGGQRPALVLVTPGSSVKEQIGATYGEALAERGFLTLTFDPSFQGQSGGEPRDLEDPAARMADVRAAIDYLQSLDDVDPHALGAVGICAGGGYAVQVAATDHRIQALGTVVAVNIGRARREGYAATDGVVSALAAIAEQRTREARGGDLQRVNWLPDSPQQAHDAGIDDIDVLDAIDYYRTPRGSSPSSTNRRLLRSDALMMGFDAFNLVEQLLVQPVLVIVGGRRGVTKSYEDGEELQRRASNSEDLVIIPGAGHYQMYDRPDYVEQAADRLAEFFQRTLHKHPTRR